MVSTFPYEQVALGINDHLYIETLEQCMVDAKMKHKDFTGALALLNVIREELPKYPAELGAEDQAGEAYTGAVNAKLDSWRTRIASEIVKLQAAVRPPGE
jgi:hypothetical protein